MVPCTRARLATGPLTQESTALRLQEQRVLPLGCVPHARGREAPFPFQGLSM